MSIVAITQKSLQKAAQIIKEGGLVAMPTETVYGLACDAFNEEAVQKVFAVKERPAINPLIVHINALSDVEKLAHITPLAKKVAFHFWPGPVTMILPRRENSGVSALCTAGLETIAVRCPVHEIARQLIQMANVPLAAPSANISGTLSPTSPRHVFDSLGERVDMILAGGPSQAGLESTVIDVTGDVPVILRYGVVTHDDLAQKLEIDVHDGVQDTVAKGAGQVKSPGQLLKHYAPTLPVRMNAVDVAPDEALLAFGNIKFMGIQTGGFASTLPEDQIRNLSENGELEEAAHNLFSYMRDLDQPKFKGIAVMNIPDTHIGTAINDRLRRASE